MRHESLLVLFKEYLQPKLHYNHNLVLETSKHYSKPLYVLKYTYTNQSTKEAEDFIYYVLESKMKEVQQLAMTGKYGELAKLTSTERDSTGILIPVISDRIKPISVVGEIKTTVDDNITGDQLDAVSKKLTKALEGIDKAVRKTLRFIKETKEAKPETSDYGILTKPLKNDILFTIDFLKDESGFIGVIYPCLDVIPLKGKNICIDRTRIKSDIVGEDGLKEIIGYWSNLNQELTNVKSIVSKSKVGINYANEIILVAMQIWQEYHEFVNVIKYDDVKEEVDEEVDNLVIKIRESGRGAMLDINRLKVIIPSLDGNTGRLDTELDIKTQAIPVDEWFTNYTSSFSKLILDKLSENDEVAYNAGVMVSRLANKLSALDMLEQ